MSVVSYAENATLSSFESRVHDGHLCVGDSKWLSVKNISLKISSNKLSMSASYDIKYYDNHDVQVVLYDESLTGNSEPGEVLLVNGRVLLIKNMKIQENYAIDFIDGVALLQQILFTIIDLSSNEGPNDTTFPFDKEISETQYPIKATTKSASGLFHPPWTSKVSLEKNNDSIISFKVFFDFMLSNGQDANLHMEGLMSNYGKVNGNKGISDNFLITDYKQYNIGPYTKKTQTGTIYDFGTTYIKETFDTLGELRTYIKDRQKQ